MTSSHLTQALAEAHRSDLSTTAAHARSGRLSALFGPRKDTTRAPLQQRTAPAVAIRRAFPDDEVAIARLAQLDSSPMPQLPALVAEVDGQIWAVLSIRGEGEIADPFRPSADLLFLLAERARQLRRLERRAARGGRRLALRLPRLV